MKKWYKLRDRHLRSVN